MGFLETLGGAAIMFQFHKVRLKVKQLEDKYRRYGVSIPQGTIKSNDFRRLVRVQYVSIPQGTIKSHLLAT